MSVQTTCSVCKKEKPCLLEPADSMLINFSFRRPMKYIDICEKCEEKRAEKFKKILENILRL